jgi:polysaccharide biosynthesis transport protein
MEAAALNQYSDAQELEPFADKVLAVFNANSVLKTANKESIQFLRSLNSQFIGALLTEAEERRG